MYIFCDILFHFRSKYDDRVKQESLKKQQPPATPKPAATTVAATINNDSEDDFDIDVI
jgi:hypothetical protein